MGYKDDIEKNISWEGFKIEDNEREGGGGFIISEL